MNSCGLSVIMETVSETNKSLFFCYKNVFGLLDDSPDVLYIENMKASWETTSSCWIFLKFLLNIYFMKPH